MFERHTHLSGAVVEILTRELEYLRDLHAPVKFWAYPILSPKLAYTLLALAWNVSYILMSTIDIWLDSMFHLPAQHGDQHNMPYVIALCK